MKTINQYTTVAALLVSLPLFAGNAAATQCANDPAAKAIVVVNSTTQCSSFGQDGCEVLGPDGQCSIDGLTFSVNSATNGGIEWSSSGSGIDWVVVGGQGSSEACAYNYDPAAFADGSDFGLGPRGRRAYEPVAFVRGCSELETQQVTELDACPDEYQDLVDALASSPLDDKKVYAFILDPTQLEKIAQCVPSDILDPTAVIEGTNIPQYQGCIEQCISDEGVEGSCQPSGWVPGVTDDITPYCHEVSAEIREQLSITEDKNTQPLVNVNNIVQVYSVNPTCFLACGNLGGRYQCTNICF